MTGASHAAPHRVVVIGCGFGGLFAVKRLGDRRIEVTVVDRTANHVFQPLLYQVATGILPAGDIAPPIRDVLRRHELDDVSRAVQAYPTCAEGAARAANQHLTAAYPSPRVRALTRPILATLRVLGRAR